MNKGWKFGIIVVIYFKKILELFKFKELVEGKDFYIEKMSFYGFFDFVLKFGCYFFVLQNDGNGMECI